MLQPNESETAAVRAVFFIDPAKKIRLIMYYPLNVGRNMDEILRALEALQTSDKYKVAMPLDWKKGDKVIFSFAENIGSGRTSNEAEYLALIKGIQECIEHEIYDVSICADSKLVVNQVNGKYKLKDSKMIKLHGEVIKLCSKLKSWNISHVVREKNTEADDLSKKGLRK